MVWKKLSKENLEETKNHFKGKGYVVQWYAMAWEIILTTLGPDWMDRNCNHASRSPENSLNFSTDSKNEGYHFQDRVIRLGSMLFGLKEAHGYETFISSLATRNVESTFFELSVANMLREDGFKVEFIAESGQKTADYDLRASIGDFEFCVEAKSRRGGQILTETTLTNTLTKAKKQLPADLPGMIFISIPEEWTKEPTAEKIITESIKTFLTNTGRVNYIMVVWNFLANWEATEEGKASVTMFREYKNENPRNSASIGRELNPNGVHGVLNSKTQIGTPSFW